MDKYSSILNSLKIKLAQEDDSLKKKLSSIYRDMTTQKEAKRKIASLSELCFFERISNDQLIHKSSKDLWNIEVDEEGNINISRLFNNDKLIEG